MTGRPTKYDEKYDLQAYKLCLLGATDKDLADFFDVSESTINLWKLEHPSFSESLKQGKYEADAEVAHKLYKRATGYSQPDIITASYEGKITDIQEVTKHFPPDTTAAIFWLKNRQPKNWRDKQEIEHAGEGGGPISVVFNSNIRKTEKEPED